MSADGKQQKDKKKVRMIRVFVIYFTDSEGMKTDSVSMECCAEHQKNAEDSLIAEHGLRRWSQDVVKRTEEF